MVLTSVCIKPPAYGGTRLIYGAAVSAIKVLAPVPDVEKPLSGLNKYRCFLMTDIPADIFKIIPGTGPVNLQCKISAAQCAASVTGALHLVSHPHPQGRFIPASDIHAPEGQRGA